MSRSQRINDALFKALMPDVLTIEDESHRHQVPTGAESHFKVTLVSTQFENLSRIARHRLLNTLLANEFSMGLHALSLFLYTPNEWQKRDKPVPNSPPCRGGDKQQ